MELVRSICAVWERGEYDSADWAHPDLAYVVVDGPAPGRWRGLAGMAEGWRGILGAWEQLRLEAEQFRELDDERVLVFYSLSGRGKRSGVELSKIGWKGACVFHVRGGKVTKLVGYQERTRALADLGLSPHADVPNA